MRGNEALNQLTAILRDLGGYFTFVDEMGEEYVVAPKKSFALTPGSSSSEPEVQLSLPPAENTPVIPTAHELLDRINQDIALFRAAQDQFDDLEILEEEENTPLTDSQLPPPRRVRFEPLRGDLSPDLQE